jgi:hypothetical protein
MGGGVKQRRLLTPSLVGGRGKRALDGLVERLRGAFRWLFRRKPVGFPLGLHVPADGAEHAVDFSRRWTDRLDEYCAIHMEELGIPPQRIGASDPRQGIAWCAFNPHEDTGGSISTGGRINVDSGVFDPDLMTKPYGRKASKVWAMSRLRDRIDAVIAHELNEADHASHEAALKAAPTTTLPITDGARRILRAMERGWRDRERRASRLP